MSFITDTIPPLIGSFIDKFEYTTGPHLSLNKSYKLSWHSDAFKLVDRKGISEIRLLIIIIIYSI